MIRILFEDSQDGVDDIYDIFTFRLENQLRDQPSGGCVAGWEGKDVVGCH